MTAIKQQIIGAIALMGEEDARKIWSIIQNDYVVKKKSWDDIEEVELDSIDLEMLSEIDKNPDCKDFVSSEEAMKELGL